MSDILDLRLDRRYIFYTLSFKCNRHCTYCMSKQFNTQTEVPHNLVLNTISKLPKVQLLLTGGEVGVYKNFLDCYNSVTNLDNLEKLIISTNGTLLSERNIKLLLDCNKKLMLVVSIHLENYDSALVYKLKELSVNLPSNIRLHIRVIFHPQYKQLCTEIKDILDTVSCYRKVLLPIYDSNIKYTKEDYNYLDWYNEASKKDDGKLQNNKGRYCVSFGINVLPNGKYNKCCNGYDTDHQFIYSSQIDDLLSPKLIFCKSQNCFFHSKCHANFDCLQDAINFLNQWKYHDSITTS